MMTPMIYLDEREKIEKEKMEKDNNCTKSEFSLQKQCFNSFINLLVP